MPNREYILAANPLGIASRQMREIEERAEGMPWRVVLVVANDDGYDVLEALRRAYSDGREDRSAETIDPRNLREYLTEQAAIQQELGDGHDELGHTGASREHWGAARALAEVGKWLDHELETRQ